jgi:hypothetical protein
MIFCDHSLQLSTKECVGQTSRKLHPRAIWGIKIDGEVDDLRLCPQCLKVFLWKQLKQVEEIYFIDPLDNLV